MLNRIHIRYPSPVLLALAAMLFSSAAQAMEIRQFDKMADVDQDQYVADLVVDGAQKVLKDDGKPDLAKKVNKLFTEVLPGDKISLGMGEFEMILARARLADLKNVEKDPNALRLEVEDAVAVTLEKNGIEVPDSFFTVMKDFKPKHPLRAMGIREFDNMTVADQADYIQFLVDVAQKVLIDDGKRELAAKVQRVFIEIPTGEKKSSGMAEFERNLAQTRVAEAKFLDDAWVEDAMAATLRNHGIALKRTSFTRDKDFKPKHPPKEKKN